MGLFHFLYTTPKYLDFSHIEINCQYSSIFFYLTDLCLVKAIWGKWFLSSPSYQERFGSTRVNHIYSRYKLNEKYLYINFPVPYFMNIQTIAFALHSNVPCYGSRLPY